MVYIILMVMVVLLVIVVATNQRRKKMVKQRRRVIRCLENMLKLGEYEDEYRELLDQIIEEPRKEIIELVRESALPKSEQEVCLAYFEHKAGVIDKAERKKQFLINIYSKALGVLVFFGLLPLLYVTAYSKGFIKEPYETIAYCLLISMAVYFLFLSFPIWIKYFLDRDKMMKKRSKKVNLVHRFEYFMDYLLGR